MKSLHLLVSVQLTLAPAVAMAAGETVPCPSKKAGQWYRIAKTDLYRKTTVIRTKIDSVDGDRLIQNGGSYVTDRMGNWIRLDGRSATPKYFSSIECPFALGETRVYKNVHYDGIMPGTKPRGTFTVTVDPELVPLTVQAGTFKVVRIVAENNWSAGWDSGSYNGTIRHVSYYAPELGLAVKSGVEAFVPDPATGRTLRVADDFELIEYSRDD